MRTVKQPPETKTCGVACVAMFTGETYEEVLRRVALSEEYQHLTHMGLIVALAERNFQFGLSFTTNRERISRDAMEPLDVDLKDYPALVGVHSQNIEGAYHWIVYDPEIGMFRDPDPRVGEKSNWDRYKFVDWTPVIEYTD